MTSDLLLQLAAYRQTAAHEAQRAARYGGERAAPPEIAANLADARAEIARLKADLRELGVAVDDLPGDEAPPPGAAPASVPPSVVQQIIGGGSGNIQAHNSTVTVTHYQGDQVAGDKVAGDKVAGDKHVHHHYPPAPAGPARLALANMPIGDDAPIPEHASLPPGSRMPLSRNPLFVGRANDLRELARALASGATTAIAAATGLGGIGKTQLASEFVHRYGQFFEGGVLWLSFADPGSVSSEVAACGGAGGMALPSFDGLPFNQQLARVKAAWLEPTPRLLVFDNCEDEALLDEWRPVSGGCRVLLTSRRARWDASLGVWALPLGVLPRPESIALLRRFRPDLVETDPDLNQIAAELGDLPLALHLAGSYLGRYARAVTPAAYLAQLRAPDRQWALLKLDGRSPTGHEQDVARTFLLSYGRLQPAQDTDALAIALLARAAHLAPGEPIPRDLLAATVTLEGDDAALRFEDALTRLCELGLIDEEANGALRLHRLICAFARGAVQDEGAQTAVEDALIAVGDATIDTYTEYLAFQPIHMHLRVAVTNCASRNDHRSARLIHYLAGYYFQNYDMDAALGAYHLALSLYRLTGSRVREANVQKAIGDIHQFRKDMESALVSYKAALTLYQRAGSKLGEANVLLATGNIHLFRKNIEAALIPYQAALTLYRSLGARLGEANVLKFIGDAQEFLKKEDAALESYQAALTAYRLVGYTIGEASTVKAMGDIQQSRNDLDAALASYQAALVLYRSVGGKVGEAHVQKEIGDVQHARNEYDAAQASYQIALALFQDHGAKVGEASVLASQSLLALSRGDRLSADDLLDQALRIYQAANDTYNVAAKIRNYGLALRRAGRKAESAPYLQRAAQLFAEIGLDGFAEQCQLAAADTD